MDSALCTSKRYQYRDRPSLPLVIKLAVAVSIIVKVDVLENAHWSDLVCKVDDVQYDQTLADLKARYADLQRAHSGREGEPGRKRKHADTLSEEKSV